MSFLSCTTDSDNHSKQIVVVARNLCTSAFDDGTHDQYKVYLRIKPSQEKNVAYAILDDKTIVTEVPKESVLFKAISKQCSSQIKRKFRFSSVLNEASQKETFDKCVLPSLKSFLQGEDCVIMAYGTTSAGKTFTLQGSTEHPGMVPRAISYLFRTLEGVPQASDKVEPYRGTQLLALDEAAYLQRCAFKNRILGVDLVKYQRATDSSYISFKSSFGDCKEFHSLDFKTMEDNIEVLEALNESFNDAFAVWVSMIEIYNENIFDLLRFHDKRDRPHLSLGDDDRGGFYVKNSCHVHVRNGHEAYQVYQFGRTNLQRAPTALNLNSSRSHCIFTIYLVRQQDDGLLLHRLAFVDLAGSERVKKTLNAGVRLAESNSINKSLSVLGNCLNALKENQNSRAQHVIPVRDSKLTRIFKNALVGLEKLTFIINITTSPILFDETLHALKFSALAQEIVPNVSQAPSRSTRFSQIFHSHKFVEPSFAWSAVSSVTDLSDKSDDVYKIELIRAKNRAEDAELREEELLILIDELESQLKESAEANNKLREEITKIQSNCMSSYAASVESKRNEIREELEFQKKRLNREKDEEVNLYKSKIDRLARKLNAQKLSNSELKEENETLRRKVEKLDALLDEAASDYQEVETEKNKYLLIIESLSENLPEAELPRDLEGISGHQAEIVSLVDKMRKVEEEMRLQLNDKQTEIDSLTSFVDNLRKVEEELNLQLNEKETKIDSLTSLVDKMSKVEEDLNLQLNGKQAEIDSLTSLVDKMKKVEEDMNLELNGKQAEIVSLTSLVDKMKTVEEDMKLELNKKQTEIDSLTSYVNEMRKVEEDMKLQMHEKQTTIDSLTAQCSELNGTQSSLVVSLEEQMKNFEEVNLQLRKDLSNEKDVLKELERENDCLKKNVKEMCTKERALTNEIESLKGVVQALEQEAAQSKSTDIENLSEELKRMELERNKNQNSILQLTDEVAQLKNKVIAQEVDYVSARKLLELEVQSTLKKLEASEYQRKVYLTLKEKADDETKVIPELKSIIERLENELINKNGELEAFESQRNFMLQKNEREIKNYQEEIERLKKDVQFGHSVVMENLKNSEKKDEVKRLQHELHQKNMKILMLEKGERSPLKNFTNFVPTGNLVDISPFHKNISGRLSKSCENVSSPFDLKQKMLKMEHSFKSKTPTPKKTRNLDKENVDSKENENKPYIHHRGTAEKKLQALSADDLFDASPVNDEAAKDLKSSPTLLSKSTRKTRTTKKRDPRDHPALSKSTRGKNRSVSPAPVPRSVKKKLFSNDDYLELSDDSDFLAPSSAQEAKRNLRPRTRRKGLEL